MTALPVVFLHGFLGSHHDWGQVMSLLSDFLCVALDLPGHGQTPFFHPFSLIPPAPKFHLVGYSMGGRLALQYADQNPEKIEKLILISTHPGLNSEKERSERLAKDEKWAKLLLESPIDIFLKQWYEQPIFAGFQPDLTSRKRQNPKLLAQTLLHYSLAKQPQGSLENAIHIVGEKDEKFKNLNPQAIQIKEAGHMIHLEQPALLANKLKECLRDS